MSGLPVLFWQQRIGQGGRRSVLQKFRSLRPPFDWRGQRVADRQKLSFIGRLLRQTRLDELPQLLNVLVGDMALIGPRPLLPEDQPANPATRLMVRPGITGWAQVNGGKFLTPEEKDQYDEFYIRNASLVVRLAHHLHDAESPIPLYRSFRPRRGGSLLGRLWQNRRSQSSAGHPYSSHGKVQSPSS